MPSGKITLRQRKLNSSLSPAGVQPSLPLTQLDVARTADSSRMKSLELDELDCKSSNDFGDGLQEATVRRGKKRKYHRHTQRQIQEMERLFKECPHPDEKMRLELSKQLNLDPRQVKFWFQNKRTQMKAQQQRGSISYLRTSSQQLKAENLMLRETTKEALIMCSHCGGPMYQTEQLLLEKQLRIENSKLKKEVRRISALAAKHLGQPLSSLAATFTPTSPELGVIVPANDDPGALGPSVAVIASRPLCLSVSEKRMVVELAVSAMEELAESAQAGESLWVPDPQTAGIESLRYEEYMQRFPPVIGPTPSGLEIEATRETGLVHMNASSLVETLMDEDRWMKMFPSIISRALTVEVLSNAAASKFDGSMQLMYAELQMPTPLVPTREVYFLRYSKKVDHLWVVVDVSVDSLRGNPPLALLRCRKRPSGCLIEGTKNGYSKVTWVEHVEVDNKGIDPSYQMLVSSGMGFGARRWLPSLQRQCERIASLQRQTSNTLSGRNTVISNLEGRGSLLRLAERMTNDFCCGVSASASHNWITLSGAKDEDCRILIRKSVGDPGRPPAGIRLCAATSVWLPVPPARVFHFLRDERCRTEWDILSSMGCVETMAHVPINGQVDTGNGVSLLRVNAMSSNQSNMMILQDCCTDKGCSLVIYAPVDMAAMSNILNGGDPNSMLPLPSGFVILPDGPPSPHPRQIFHDVSSISTASSISSCGSLLTIAFQVLVDDLPSAKHSPQSMTTVSNLISFTVAKIKGALFDDNA